MTSAITRASTERPERVRTREILREERVTSLSCRSIFVTATEAGEAVEVRSSDGEVEIRIAFGDEGPIVYVRSTRLALETPDTLALRCRRLEVNAVEGICLDSQGSLQLAGQDMHVETVGDIRLNGGVIRLN